MTLEAAANIASTTYYLLDKVNKEDLEDILPELFGVLGLDYSNGVIYYQDTAFTKPDRLQLFNKTTPVDLKIEEIEEIEGILNDCRYFTAIIEVFPILDSIGWVVNNELGVYKIHFEGSNIYEMWNEPMMRWDDDIDDDEQCNWWEGDGWVDDLEFNKLTFNWKDSVEELESDSYIIDEE